MDGWLIDHEIAEVWDGSAERWRLVEPEIDDDHTDPVDGASFDALDVPPDRFLTAPRAWQLARSGAVDPDVSLPTLAWRSPPPEAGPSSGTTWSTTSPP